MGSALMGGAVIAHGYSESLFASKSGANWPLDAIPPVFPTELLDGEGMQRGYYNNVHDEYVLVGEILRTNS